MLAPLVVLPGCGIALLLATLLSTQPVSALELLPAKARRSQYGLSIAVEKNQEIVLFDRRQEVEATGVLAIIKATPNSVGPMLRAAASHAFGEHAWVEREHSDNDYWVDRYGGSVASHELRTQRLQQLAAAGITVSSFRVLHFQSRKYNVRTLGNEERGSSRLQIWIFDGSAVFGPACTLVRLQRRDEVFGWAWTTQTLIPARTWQALEFVSTQELALLEEVAHRLNAPLRVEAEINSSLSLAEATTVPALIRLSVWLRESSNP